MKRISDFLFVRHRHNWLLLIRFGLVGGSGVLVNMLVAVICNKVGPFHDAVVVPIPGTEFSIRWYHAYFLISFLVANLWNFQLNRMWTFKSSKHAPWLSEYGPFLAVGLVAMAIGQLIITSLMNPTSPVALPTDLLDDSTGLRTRYYWAQLIAVFFTIPVSFLVNKVWTFRSVRGVKATFDEADAEDEAETDRTETGRTETAGTETRRSETAGTETGTNGRHPEVSAKEGKS
ncbi:GtrA family protein [Propionibacteriaceae bacterium Y2011]|uniref:GtrA family protein n=1 Tax=Microlunatus sp. Y2014 TaxID=3418488 RepID=UPI003B4BAEDF